MGADLSEGRPVWSFHHWTFRAAKWDAKARWNQRSPVLGTFPAYWTQARQLPPMSPLLLEREPGRGPEALLGLTPDLSPPTEAPDMGQCTVPPLRPAGLWGGARWEEGWQAN